MSKIGFSDSVKRLGIDFSGRVFFQRFAPGNNDITVILFIIL